MSVRSESRGVISEGVKQKTVSALGAKMVSLLDLRNLSRKRIAEGIFFVVRI